MRLGRKSMAAQADRYYLYQEAVQDTLVAASERARQGDGRAPRRWLANVLRNGLRQALRARGRRAVHEELSAPTETAERSALDIVSHRIRSTCGASSSACSRYRGSISSADRTRSGR